MVNAFLLRLALRRRESQPQGDRQPMTTRAMMAAAAIGGLLAALAVTPSADALPLAKSQQASPPRARDPGSAWWRAWRRRRGFGGRAGGISRGFGGRRAGNFPRNARTRAGKLQSRPGRPPRPLQRPARRKPPPPSRSALPRLWLCGSLRRLRRLLLWRLRRRLPLAASPGAATGSAYWWDRYYACIED